MTGVDWTLEHSEGSITGVTASDGVISAALASSSGHAVLKYRNCSVDLELAQLPPVDETAGLQHRLNNLGYSCGLVTGTMDEPTRSALKAFQQAHAPLDVTGEPDDRTRGKIREVYGH
jgi:N-acetyl-anhydromuramyl-L-alanine amidase AmpD